MSVFLAGQPYSLLVAELCRVLRMGYLHRRDLENLVAGELVLRPELWGDDPPNLEFDEGAVIIPSHENLIRALVTLEPDETTGIVEPDQIMLVLAEHGDVWPDSMQNDSARLDSLTRMHAIEVLGRRTAP